MEQEDERAGGWRSQCVGTLEDKEYYFPCASQYQTQFSKLQFWHIYSSYSIT
jgi:hypothetical protein